MKAGLSDLLGGPLTAGVYFSLSFKHVDPAQSALEGFQRHAAPAGDHRNLAQNAVPEKSNPEAAQTPRIPMCGMGRSLGPKPAPHQKTYGFSMGRKSGKSRGPRLPPRTYGPAASSSLNPARLPKNTWIWKNKELRPQSGATASNSWVFDHCEWRLKQGANSQNTWVVSGFVPVPISALIILGLN
jgi:hypothetical protein